MPPPQLALPHYLEEPNKNDKIGPFFRKDYLQTNTPDRDHLGSILHRDLRYALYTWRTFKLYTCDDISDYLQDLH